jgi:hypothetical protein
MRFENKIIFFYILWKNDVANYNSGVVVVNSEVVGLGPDLLNKFFRGNLKKLRFSHFQRKR